MWLAVPILAPNQETGCPSDHFAISSFAYPYLAVTKQDIPDRDITHQLKRYDVVNRLSSY